MKTVIAISFLALSFNSFAKNCSGELMVPNLTCINAKSGTDVRLHIMEFQTCVNDEITEIDRSILGMHVLSKKSVDDIHTINAEDMTIKYMDQRIMIDPEDRGDNLSFLLPSEVKMIDGKETIEMAISTKTAPDYEGASSKHFVGSFKVLKENGELKSKGKLACFVTR